MGMHSKSLQGLIGHEGSVLREPWQGHTCTRRPTLPFEPSLLRTRWSEMAPADREPSSPPSSRPDTCTAAFCTPLSCRGAQPGEASGQAC